MYNVKYYSQKRHKAQLTGHHHEFLRHDVALSAIAIDHLQIDCGRVQSVSVTVAGPGRQKL